MSALNVSIESQNVWTSEKKMVSRCSSRFNIYGWWEIRCASCCRPLLVIKLAKDSQQGGVAFYFQLILGRRAMQRCSTAAEEREQKRSYCRHRRERHAVNHCLTNTDEQAETTHGSMPSVKHCTLMLSVINKVQETSRTAFTTWLQNTFEKEIQKRWVGNTGNTTVSS